MAASEAKAVGHGGVTLLHRACGLSRKAILKGIRELEAGIPLAPGRIRRPGCISSFVVSRGRDSLRGGVVGEDLREGAVVDGAADSKHRVAVALQPPRPGALQPDVTNQIEIRTPAMQADLVSQVLA